ncbi:MAG: SBBP repeat-containing protein [Betaproteobacteria bacterium]|nr:SBBP repeat-containing protein [Betaproteobacteria bacterium]
MVDPLAAVKPRYVMLLLAGTLAAMAGMRLADAASRTDQQRALEGYGRLPMLFEPIEEASGAGRRYVARGAGYQAAISRRGAQVALPVPAGPDSGTPAANAMMVVDIAFADANARASIRGLDAQSTRIHHLRSRSGVPDRTDVATYARVAIDALYPGIDAVFYGNAQRLEYDLVIAPGADPSRVRLHVDGITGMELVGDGDLRLDTGHGAMTLRRPLAYQERDGAREHVDSRYVIGATNIVEIRVGAYDRSRRLVIDPVVSYATYLGGSLTERGTAVAVDANGNAYVTGFTTSPDFPLLSAYDRSLGKRNDIDVFVAKLNPQGTGLVYATYLGGPTGIDRGIGIAVDPSGSAYVAGTTSGGDFPITAGAYQQATPLGGTFIAKLAPAGNALVYSTYVAGARVASMAVDATGSALVTGTASASFATTVNALQRTLAPGLTEGGFVLKLDPAGSAARYATFLPGNGGSQGNAIAVDRQDNAYVAGWTTAVDFPSVDAFQPALKGQRDGFIVKLDPGGSRIIYSTYLGGLLDDAINAIAVDAEGNAYVAGETYSSDFPSLDAFQPRKSGFRLVNSSLGNAFVAKIDATGTGLRYSSFLGGEICTSYCQSVFGLPQFPGDAAYGIAVDGAGHAYVTGLAQTYTFPLVDSAAPRKQQDNQDSAFVAKVSASGGSLLFSTFLRTGYGYTDDKVTPIPPGSAAGVAAGTDGAAYVTGYTDGTGQFQPTTAAFQTVNGGSQGAYVVRFAGPSATLALETSSAYVDSPASAALTATVTGTSTAGSIALMSGASVLAYAPIVADKAVFDIKLPVGIHSLTALLATPGAYLDSAALQQVVDNPLACIK